MARTETITVMFTDLVNSTELANRLGHDAYEAFRLEHFTRLRRATEAHNGIEVKTTGDGLMLSFSSAADAVACGIAMQQTAGNTEIRIGASSGEATNEDDDLFGPPVVEAARLCDAANTGQILVSDIICLLVRGKGHSFNSVGEMSLKGLPEPVPASEVVWEPIAAGVPLPPRLGAQHVVEMVGRKTEQEALARALERAKGGERQVVLLSGEPGIGKTRLATETARAAHDEGATVLLGSCDEDVHLPYQPFVEALRYYVTHAPDDVLTEHVREHKGELGRLVPELAHRVNELPAPQVAEAETERYLLFDAVAGLLATAARDTPLVLVIDDLQWAGAPELALLKHIMRSPQFSNSAAPASPGEAADGTARPARLLIIGTYRDSDLTRSHPLTGVLADWRSERGVERVALHGLDDDGVADLVASAAGHRLAESGIALARALHQETEGSPFFIGEILRHLTESGALTLRGDRWNFEGSIADLAIPQGVKEVIGRRLSRMSDETNKVLGLASVIGRQFDVELLTRITAASEDSVLDALDAASAASLVTEVAGQSDSFSFSHALIRTTLYEEMSNARRARVHRKVGEALEELTRSAPTARIDELAHHWLNAARVVDAAKAVDYSRRAGDHALGNLAFEEAEAHYARALGALESDDRSGEELRYDLLLALANAQRPAGNDRYRETVARAVEVARRLGDGERLALAAVANARPGGFMASASIVDEELIALYEEANNALGDADSLLRARVLGQLAAELMYTPHRNRRHKLSGEAVAIARRLRDPKGLAEILIVHLLATNDPLTLAERLTLTAELVALAEEIGSSEIAWHAAYHRTSANLESGDIESTRQAVADAKRLAEELRQPFFRWWVAIQEGMLAVLTGAPDAEARVFATLESDQSDAAMPFGAQMVTLLNNLGRNSEIIDTLRTNVESHPHIVAWRAALARAYTTTDQLQEAREHLDVLIGDRLAPPHNWVTTGFYSTVSEVVADLGSQEAAAVLYDRLQPIAGQVSVVSAAVTCSGSFAFYCGRLAVCLGRHDDAQRHFSDALAMNERLGARPWVVRTRRVWADMLVDRGAAGDTAEARDLIATALPEAETLGMAREVVCLERLKARLA